jgi:hypothetical protein
MKYESISRKFSAMAAILGFVRRTNEVAGAPGRIAEIQVQD